LVENKIVRSALNTKLTKHHNILLSTGSFLM